MNGNKEKTLNQHRKFLNCQINNHNNYNNLHNP